MKLKLCPFCGGEADIIKRKNSKLYSVGCKDLSCYAWTCLDENCDECGGYTSKESAIKDWNTRFEKELDEECWNMAISFLEPLVKYCNEETNKPYGIPNNIIKNLAKYLKLINQK